MCCARKAYYSKMASTSMSVPLDIMLRHAGKVVPGGDRSIQSRADVARLAAALTRASLPMQHRVVTADALPNGIV